MMRFAQPLWLFLLIVPLYTLFSYFRKKGRGEATILFSDVGVFDTIGTGAGTFKRLFSLFIAHAALIVLIFAMARPQSGTTFHTRTARGIDIILAMDISSSMAAMDFDPLTRFEASKKVVNEFIENRMSDRIGIVVFSAQSFTLCPLTLDYDMLREFLDRAWESRIEDGTAIGSAIATSVNRLRTSDAKSKIIILLTDGMNNRGNIDPLTAARLAETMKIKIYAIGVGTEGKALFKMNGRPYWTETHIDEESLREVAKITGGKYYRAKNERELQGIYAEINKLETTKIDYKEWVEYDERYAGLLKAGFILLLLSFLLDRTILRRLP
ncbi:VWA domain-containing protein [bacterium]|nr:VWA domain-containing protein [bacterium]